MTRKIQNIVGGAGRMWPEDRRWRKLLVSKPPNPRRCVFQPSTQLPPTREKRLKHCSKASAARGCWKRSGYVEKREGCAAAEDSRKRKHSPTSLGKGAQEGCWVCGQYDHFEDECPFICCCYSKVLGHNIAGCPAIPANLKSPKEKEPATSHKTTHATLKRK